MSQITVLEIIILNNNLFTIKLLITLRNFNQKTQEKNDERIKFQVLSMGNGNYFLYIIEENNPNGPK